MNKKIAIYTRKSKLTDRGESIQNQIEMCKNYAHMNFSTKESDIIVYEDEGYSGGSTDRPEFKRLMQDIAEKRFDAVMCYKLDRISRNVLDFSNILEVLSKNNTSFISITEHFDTTTPIGRAMVNIAAVFAQLERETIAERIRDNMRRLARTGRYIGSTPPFGFKSERIDYIDQNGNKKKMHRLTPDPEDMAFVKLVYDKYLELESLSKVETWLMQNQYKNRNGNYTGVTELRRLLTNPVYVNATESIFDYYTGLGTDVVNPKEEFDGNHGMLIYGRHDRDGAPYTPSKWTVVIAKHEGVINDDRWLSAQNLLQANKIKAPRAGTSKNGLLTSKIKCGNCGGTMVLIYGADKKKHYYKCRNKIKSRKTVCDIKNINGINADKEILDYLIELSKSQDQVLSILKTKKSKAAMDKMDENVLALEEFRLKKLIKEKETYIKNLTVQLRENKSSVASKHIIADIEALDGELQKLNDSLTQVNTKMSKVEDYSRTTQISLKAIMDFGKNAGSISFIEKRKLIDKIIDNIIWDGETFTINFK